MRFASSSVLFVVLTTIVVVVTITSLPNSSQKSTDNGVEAQSNFVKSYILQGSSSRQLTQFIAGVGGTVVREFPIINAVSAMLTRKQVDEIKKEHGIRVQDDRTVVTSGNRKGNGLLGATKTYTLNNHIAEQTGADRLHDMNITGKGVTVAVVDSGINMWGATGHYLFKDSNDEQRVSVKYDAFKGHETLFFNDDQNGHGSHVSGIIASSLKSEKQKFNGMAPDVYLLSIKAFDQDGESSYTTVLDALNWIFDNRYKYKIRVVNMSVGAKVQSHYWNDPINQAVMRLWDAGVVIVSSAGNNGKDMGITVPGNNPYILTVGAATDSGTPYDKSDDRLATFSARGPTYEGFVKPEVLAYGANISSKLDERFLKQQFNLSQLGEHYSEVSGTSQAAAIVSGLAALIISNDPYATPDEVKCRIMQSAQRAQNDGMATYSPFQQGAGLVDAYRAVMSFASNCANTNMNIKEDLLGINHFIGPAKADAAGNFVIKLADGTILTRGEHWSDDDGSFEGTHWDDLTTAYEGQYWSSEDMSLQGMYWGGQEMTLKNIYWGKANVDLDGMYRGSVRLNLQRADLALYPIDPNVDVPITQDGWQ
jgi:serine protease AprX